MENFVLLLGIVGALSLLFIALLVAIAGLAEYMGGYCDKCGFAKDLCCCEEYSDAVY